MASTQHDRFGRSIVDFCDAVGIGRTFCYRLIGEGSIRIAKVGRRTVVVTQPDEFLANRPANLLPIKPTRALRSAARSA